MSKLLAGGVACVALSAAWFGYSAFQSPSRAARTVSAQERTRTGTDAIPVTAAPVVRQDVPIVLEGLGTVQPMNTATMHSQVQGVLLSVDFVEGQEVRKGDRLARIDPRVYQAQLDQALAALGRDQALLTNAQADLSRSLALLGRGFATPQQVDTERAKVGQLSNTVKLDQAAVEGAQTQLSFTTITAPFDGVTGIQKIDPGNIVHPTDASGLVTITQIHPISVIFTLPSADIARIRAAQAKGPVVVEAYDAANKIKLDEGQLLLIDNQVDVATGTVRLKATFPNDKRMLWPGVFVNAHLVLAIEHDALTLPISAVQQGPAGPFVYVVGPDQRVSVRPVTTGQSRNGEVIVTEGVKAGESVVATGQYRLSAGAAVEMVPPKRAGEVQNASTGSAGMLP